LISSTIVGRHDLQQLRHPLAPHPADHLDLLAQRKERKDLGLPVHGRMIQQFPGLLDRQARGEVGDRRRVQFAHHFRQPLLILSREHLPQFWQEQRVVHRAISGFGRKVAATRRLARAPRSGSPLCPGLR
jgi:hypothetical protein